MIISCIEYYILLYIESCDQIYNKGPLLLHIYKKPKCKQFCLKEKFCIQVIYCFSIKINKHPAKNVWLCIF